MSRFVIATFYQFADFPATVEMQKKVKAKAQENSIIGSILLAKEGVNGTIAGERIQVDAMLAYLRSFDGFSTMEHKESLSELPPFKRLKVRLRQELISLGDPSVDPRKKVGTYVDASEWNDLIDRPDVTLIDTRNDFEVAIGTFQGAVDPKTDCFKSFPEYVEQNLDPDRHPRVAMFCTGGIRCEKATSYLIEKGFKEVYHLRGGILKYLEEIPEEQSKWEGECFVFDERVSVDHNLERGSYDACWGCGRPLSEKDQASPLYEKGVACPACHPTLTEAQKAAFRERQYQIEHAQARNEKHLGPKEQVNSGGVR